VGYLRWRAVQLLIAVWGISTVVFFLVRLSGDPLALYLSEQSTLEQRAELTRQLGFDSPLPVQYLRFLGQAATGNFGISMRTGLPAMEMVFGRLGATLELSVAALLLAVVVGVPVGLIAAARRDTLFDRFVMALAVVGQGVPSFLQGVLLIWLFSVEWHLLPVGGRGTVSHLVLPTLTLATFSLARLARLTRSAVLEILGQDFIRTAKAKGLGDRVVLYGHALKNASIPIVTAIGLSFSVFFGSAVVTEVVFFWPGIGRLLVQSVGARDYPVVQAAVFVTAVFVTVANLVTDLAYLSLDPRIRYS